MELSSLHGLWRAAHIAAGSIGLLLFWCVMCTRKGSNAHRLVGKWFVFIARLVCATAAVSCVWAICAPLQFAHVAHELTPDEQARLSGNIRFLFSILATLMAWLVAGIEMGLHVIRNKDDFSRDSMHPISLWLISGTISLVCGLYGGLLLILGDFNGILPLFLSWVGISEARSNIGLLCRTSTESTAWIGKHIECMIGAGVGMHTAFFVFGFKHLIRVQLQGVWQMIPWFIPVVIGIPAISLLTRKYTHLLQSEPAASGGR